MATEVKENRKVKYTKMVLKASLLALMKSNPINKITVTDICKTADVNRGTFYLYYLDAYDLLEKIQSELLDEINVSVEKLVKDDTSSKALLLEIFQVIEKNGDLCKIIFNENGDRNFVKKILLIMRDKVLSEWMILYKNTKVDHLDYLYNFISAGTIGVIQQWLLNGMQEKPAEITALVDELTKSCTDVIKNSKRNARQ